MLKSLRHNRLLLLLLIGDKPSTSNTDFPESDITTSSPAPSGAGEGEHPAAASEVNRDEEVSEDGEEQGVKLIEETEEDADGERDEDTARAKVSFFLQFKTCLTGSTTLSAGEED